MDAIDRWQPDVRRIKELEAQIEVLNTLLDTREKLVEAIPECKEHGAGCVPHAIEWVEKAKELEAESANLRGLLERARPYLLYHRALMFPDKSPDDSLPISSLIAAIEAALSEQEE
jgi:hypothetical protein